MPFITGSLITVPPRGEKKRRLRAYPPTARGQGPSRTSAHPFPHAPRGRISPQNMPALRVRQGFARDTRSPPTAGLAIKEINLGSRFASCWSTKPFHYAGQTCCQMGKLNGHAENKCPTGSRNRSPVTLKTLR